MRFRRHVPRRTGWLEGLKAWMLRTWQRAAKPTGAPRPTPPPEGEPLRASELTPAPVVVPAAAPETLDEPWAPDDSEPVDPTTPSVRWARRPLSPRARVAVTTVGAFLGTFLLGYLVAALVLFPAPIFATTRTIPRVLGLVRSEAETRLTEGGLRLADIEGVTHPTAARGQVVWQDPPAGVGVPEGTLIRLTVSNGPQRVPVPDLLGYHATVARQLLEAAGLEVGRLIQTQAPVPQGVVVSTRPSTGSPILPGSAVTLVVSVGAPTITVPDLTGLTQEEADLILQQVGLTLGTTLRQASRDVPPGTIVEQAPAVGTLSAPGTAVNIFIARAPSR